VSPAHFAEPQGLIVIIALGESIVAIGIGAAGVSLTAGVLTAAVLGTLAIAALWWAYFDVYAVNAPRVLAKIHGAARARLARDYYSYVHMPMVAGIVLFALGLKTLEHVGNPLAPSPPWRSVAGWRCTTSPTSSSAFAWFTISGARRRRDRAGSGGGRPVAAIVLLALLAVAPQLSALTALAVTAVCCAVVVYEVIHYREDRARVRAARP
jgi:low temperature requirement protein LtrA